MPHYTEMNWEEDEETIIAKPENKNKKLSNSIGKHNNKHIFKNHGQYGIFYTHDKINYRIPPYVGEDKIDFELVKNYIVYKNEMNEKYKTNSTLYLSEDDL